MRREKQRKGGSPPKRSSKLKKPSRSIHTQLPLTTTRPNITLSPPTTANIDSTSQIQSFRPQSASHTSISSQHPTHMPIFSSQKRNYLNSSEAAKDQANFRNFSKALDNHEAETDKKRGIHQPLRNDDTMAAAASREPEWASHYSELAKDPKYRRFLPESDYLAPDTVRLSNTGDFNLDFDLELKWQKVQGDKVYKEGTYLQRHQEKEYEEVFNMMVAAKHQEFEQERLHLEAVKQKKEQVKAAKVKLFIQQQLALAKRSQDGQGDGRGGSTDPLSLPSPQPSKVVQGPELLAAKIAEIEKFAQQQGLIKTKQSLLSAQDLARIDGIDIGDIKIDPETIIQQGLERMIESDFHLDTRIGAGKDVQEVDEMDVLASYYGYSDILQEMFESDIITPSNSILKKVEYAEDPEYQQKSEELIKDLISEHKLPLQHVSAKKVAQELQHAKRNLVHKEVALVHNEFGEIDFRHVTPQHQRVLLAQKHHILPPLAPQPHEGGFPTIVPRETQHPTASPDHDESASKLKDVLSQITDFTAYQHDMGHSYPSEAEVREIIANQQKLTESGRNDRFDNFNDDLEFIDLKQRLFKKHNEELKAKWAFEVEMKRKIASGEITPQQLLLHNNTTISNDGLTPLLRSFQAFQAPKENKNNNPYETLKIDSIKAAGEHLAAEELAFEEYVDDEGVTQRIPFTTLDKFGQPIILSGQDQSKPKAHQDSKTDQKDEKTDDLPLHKRLKYHANDDELYKALSDDLDSIYPIQIEETGRSEFMKKFDIEKPYFLREDDDYSSDEASKIEDILGGNVGKRSKSDRAKLKEFEAEMNKPENIEKLLFNALSDLYEDGANKDGESVYKLKGKGKNGDEIMPEGDELEAQFQKMRIAAAKRGIPYTQAQLEDAVDKFYSSATPDFNSTENIKLNESRELLEMDFVRTSASITLDDATLDTVIDPGTGKDPLAFASDGGDSMFVKSKQFTDEKKRLEEIQQRREEAMKQRRIKSMRGQLGMDMGGDDNEEHQKIKQALHEDDQKFFNDETGDLFTSRPAKVDRQTVYNYVDGDHLEDIETVDDMSSMFMKSLFKKGADRGGMGWGEDSRDQPQADEQIEQLQSLPKHSPRKGLDSDALQMHPIDFMNKFMFRIHPDMFAAEKYRVVDDRLHQRINASKSRQRKEQLTAQIGPEAMNLPASSVEYETGSFSNPANIRYYEVTSHFLQTHNTKALTDLNTLLDFYKKLTSLDERDKNDPFVPHLKQGNIPPKQQFVFFVRGARGTVIRKPKNVKLIKSIWDNAGDEIKPWAKRKKGQKSKPTKETVDPNDDELLSMLIGEDESSQKAGSNDDELDEETKKLHEEYGKEIDDDDDGVGDETPHIRAVRVCFNPPRIGPGTEPRDQTTAWILALERAMVEILSGIEEDVPLSVRERWRTDLDNAIVSKAFLRVVQKKETQIDKVFKVGIEDQVAPTEDQLNKMWTNSSLAYFHMFPYANKVREADFRSETHPRHHLFNAMVVGGYIQFDSTITPKQRIKQLHDFHRLVATSYQHFDCYRWWTRNISDNDILEQAQIEQYINQGDSKKGKLTEEQEAAKNVFPYFDEERQNVWPRTHMGESFTLRMAVKFVPEGEAPKAQIISSKRILVNTHGTQASRADLLRKLLKVGSTTKESNMKQMQRDGYSTVGRDDGAAYHEDQQFDGQKTEKLFDKLEKRNERRQKLLQLSKKYKKKIDLDLLTDDDSSSEDGTYQDSDTQVKTANSKRLQQTYVDSMTTGIYGANNRQHLIRHKDTRQTAEIDDSDELDLIFNYIDELDAGEEGKVETPEEKSLLGDKRRKQLDKDESFYSPPVSMNDACLQIKLPLNMDPEDVQNFILTHGYILYDEWKSKFTEYHIEYSAMLMKQDELSKQRLATGKVQPGQIEHVFAINECLHFLDSDLAYKEQMVTNKKTGVVKSVKYSEVVMNRLAKQQPMLSTLVNFYHNMQDIKYKHVNPAMTPEKQQKKEQDEKAKIDAVLNPKRAPIDVSTLQPDYNVQDLNRQKGLASSKAMADLQNEYGARSLGVLLQKNNQFDPIMNKLQEHVHRELGYDQMPNDNVPKSDQVASGQKSSKQRKQRKSPTVQKDLRSQTPTSPPLPVNSKSTQSHPQSSFQTTLDKQLAQQKKRLFRKKIDFEEHIRPIRSYLRDPIKQPIVNAKDGMQMIISPQFRIANVFDEISTSPRKDPEYKATMQFAQMYRLDELEEFEEAFEEQREIVKLREAIDESLDLCGLFKTQLKSASQLSPKKRNHLEAAFISVSAQYETQKQQLDHSKSTAIRKMFPEFMTLLEDFSKNDPHSLNNIQHHALKETMKKNQHLWRQSSYTSKLSHTRLEQELLQDEIAQRLPTSQVRPYLERKIAKEETEAQGYTLDFKKPFDFQAALVQNFKAIAHQFAQKQDLEMDFKIQTQHSNKQLQIMHEYLQSSAQKLQGSKKAGVPSPFSSKPVGQVSRSEIRRPKQEKHAYKEATRDKGIAEKFTRSIKEREQGKIDKKQAETRHVASIANNAIEQKQKLQRNLKTAIELGQAKDLPMDIQLKELNRWVDHTVVNHEAMTPKSNKRGSTPDSLGFFGNLYQTQKKTSRG